MKSYETQKAMTIETVCCDVLLVLCDIITNRGDLDRSYFLHFDCLLCNHRVTGNYDITFEIFSFVISMVFGKCCVA